MCLCVCVSVCLCVAYIFKLWCATGLSTTHHGPISDLSTMRQQERPYSAIRQQILDLFAL